MRISDWSSDVCSSDLSIKLLRGIKGDVPLEDYRIPLGVAKIRREGTGITLVSYGWQVHECTKAADELQKEGISCEVIDLRTQIGKHTSELQSLMRNSYAVFCLKKQNTQQQHKTKTR